MKTEGGSKRKLSERKDPGLAAIDQHVDDYIAQARLRPAALKT